MHFTLSSFAFFVTVTYSLLCNDMVAVGTHSSFYREENSLSKQLKLAAILLWFPISFDSGLDNFWDKVIAQIFPDVLLLLLLL